MNHCKHCREPFTIRRHVCTTTNPELTDMRKWIADSLSCYEDRDLTDAEVRKAVGFHYEGGTSQFKIDSIPTYPHERITA